MMAPPPLTQASLIATLNSGSAWPGGPITFSIPTAGSTWPGYAPGSEPFRPGYAPPPAELAPQIRLAMQRWDALIAPGLLEVTEPGGQGQLRVAFTHLGEDDGGWGYAYYPTGGASAVAGDVWIDPSHRGESFAPETYNFQALLHELGHALGLKHSFETPNVLAAEYDTHRHTLMSYTQPQDRFVPSFTVTQTSPTSSSIRAEYGAVVMAGPQLLDVLVIQAIYGADPTTRAGDTTYGFDPAIASIQTIYDAGGTDTWDLSGSTRSSLIDLREGAFSSVNSFSVAAQIEASLAQVGESWRGFVTSVFSGDSIFTWENNVSIAYGTIIENLRLGSAGDHALGNAAANAFWGHDGNDTLLGEGGNDSLEGGAGNDSLVGGAGDDTISGGSGSDVAVFTGARAQYIVTRDGSTGIVTVRDDTAGRDGTDLLQADVEALRFSDGDHLASSFPGVVSVLSIAALSANQAEGNAGMTNFTFIVSRTGDTTGAASAAWAVTGSGANPATGVDFPHATLPSGTVSFAAGVASQTVTIHVQADSTVEPDEGFAVTLSAPAGATLGTASATGTIRNDDARIDIAYGARFVPTGPLSEGNAGSTPFYFTAFRSGDTSREASVDWTISGSVDGLDFKGFVLPSGTVIFAAGQSERGITVNVDADNVIEPDESFTLTLSAPVGASIGVASASATIRNDDFRENLPPTLGIAALSANKAEGNSGVTPFTFIVARKGATTSEVSASWTISAGWGVNGADFAGGVMPSGTVSFAANQTIQTITINVAGDDLVEADERFTVLLSSPTHAVLGTARAEATIQSDDASIVPPVLAIAAVNADRSEGEFGLTPFTFTVTRTGDLTGVSSVSWAVTGNGATASDFPGGVLPSGTINFVGGQTNTTITVNVAGDSLTEANEGFTVTLSAPTGATLGVASATGTIRNDDALAITGTAGPDTLTGTAAGEPILGLGDHDSLDGGGGDDSLTGGAGDDRLTGGLGLDRFEVDAGSDTIADLGLGGAEVLVIAAGATANATLAAAWTATSASANNGTANLTTAGFSLDLGLATGSAGWGASNLGSNRAVTLTGSLRNDRLTGGLANDTLRGGAGHDSLAGEAGQDSLLGGEGTDTLVGGAGHDRLLGEAGNDSLSGGAGNDTMTGGAGVDRFLVEEGTDTLLDLADGGNDLLIVSAGATANATLAAAWTASGNASNAGVVNITAGGFGVNLAAAAGLAPGLWTVTNAGHASAVSFTGSLLRDRLTGGLGADSLVGGLGDDTLTGGDGADTLNGGAGVDSLVGGLGDDTMTGGQEVDRFLVEAGTDTLTDLGLGGNDVLVVQAGAAAVVTMGGHWTPSAGTSNSGAASVAVAGYNVNLASVGGASGWALSNAHVRAVNLVGSSQADTITGGIGEDKLRGHGGADSLVGGAGNDQIWGGAGNDTMTGGAGMDRFSVDFGTDVITDLGAGGADVVIVSAGATLQATLAANWTATTATINGGVTTLIVAGFNVILNAANGVSGWNVSNAGNPKGVSLAGSFQADTLTGGDGDDTIDGTQNNNGGTEFLDGGAGADWLFGSYAVLFGGPGSQLNGGEGADTLVGGAGSDTMTGGAGIDRFHVFRTDVITDLGAGGADVVICYVGHTLQATLAADWTATSASINGGVANLTAAGFDVNLQAASGISGWKVSNAGDANAVRLTGSVGNDWLVGGEGADMLRGIAGLDTLEGGGGADTLDGEGGDRLTGGAGADVFVFTSPEGLDGCVITDFNAAEGDRLDLRALDADPELAGRQLDFIGSDPFGEIILEGAPTGVNTSGAMRFENGWLQFDVNADSVADRQMQLLGVTTLTAAEMWL